MLREFAAVYGTGIGREEALTRGGSGLITAGITVRAGQRGRPAGTATLGAGKASEEGRKNSDPVVG